MKTWGVGNKQQENMNFSETRILFFMQMVVLMKTKGKKKHSHNNFAYRADDSLSKENGFQSSSWNVIWISLSLQ